MGVRASVLAAAVAVGLVAATVAGPAQAEGVGRPREVYVALTGAQAAGPAADQRVHVLKVGSDRARQVLVLVPGMFGAAGDFRALARELAERLPDTQVWAVDRRDQDLADLSGFRLPPDRAAAYYLGGRYRAQTARTAPFAERWGLAVQLADLRRVVAAAGDGGRRRVVLGGHSWGATTALAYAAWDFDGRAGYRDLAGLVLIDGGVHDAFAGEGVTYRLTAEQAAAWQGRIEGGEVFDDSLAIDGRPETLPILQQLAGRYAVTAPDRLSALAPLLPAGLRPSGPVTNLGLIDWLFHTHALVPDAAFNPAFTSPVTVAEALAGPEPAALEQYWPNRLTLDLEAADPFADTPAARQLGLRLLHGREIDVPLYSFQSGLTHGSANQAAAWVAANSRIPYAAYAGNEAMTHLDALWASPDTSTVLATLTPFLAHLGEP